MVKCVIWGSYNNLSKFVTKNVGGSFTFEAYNSKEYTDGISFAINQDGQYKVNHVLDNKWGKVAVLATKDDFVIKTYTIAGKAVNAETTADFEQNIALSGYTPLGIVGTRLNAYGSVTLVYADLVDDTKARVRVRNNGTESVTGENVIIRVLYFKS